FFFSFLSQHFTELLDDFSQDVLGQLLNDPFLSDKNEMMEVELSPASPAPLIQAEHSYSLCGDSRPQSPLTHISADDNFNEADLENEDWCLGSDVTSTTVKTEPSVGEAPGLAPSISLTATPTPTTLEEEEPQIQDIGMAKPLSHTALPEIKLEPHEVDQFLNLSSKEVVDTLHMPPTPPSSHGSDSEGGQSPARSLPPSSPTQLQATVKVTSRTASALTSSPLLTAPHISAQESRRKKKEYMDSLEKKVETCSNENSELRKKVEVLENTNRKNDFKIVVVLCFAITFGSFSQIYGPNSSITKAVLPTQHSTPESYAASIVRSRSLLIYDGAPPLEEQHFSDRSSGWDRHLEASTHSALSLESVSRSHHDQVMEIMIANETRLEKSMLVELQQHR
ncbi:hypothetical protein JD844_028596, partial [Phrynosoma platyrhinos]